MQRRIHRIEKELIGLLGAEFLVQKSLRHKLKHRLDQRAWRRAGLFSEDNISEFFFHIFGQRRNRPPPHQLIPRPLGNFRIGRSGIIHDQLLGHVLIPVDVRQPQAAADSESQEKQYQPVKPRYL